MTAQARGDMPGASPPLLLPRPVRIERLAGTVALGSTMSVGGNVDLAAAQAALGPDVRAEAAGSHAPVIGCRVNDAGSTDESYRLTICPTSPTAIEIESEGPWGILHGLSTLRQLRRQYGATLPALSIQDRPSFTHRGVMLDVSRDRVPTMAELLRVVDQLAELKFNHLQLYTEHTFAYSKHERVWRGWSPITPAEVRELDAFCRLRGVTLVANQNCFGHLASWLRYPEYAGLAEIQGPDTEWRFYEYVRKGPFSLCPTDPGSLALVKEMLSELLPCFSSKLVNINCDETADVGQGRSREAVRERGSAAVYFDFVCGVADAVRAHGFRPSFWADIALSHPEAIGRIPGDMIALAWGYEPDAPFGTWCRALREAGIEAWVSPGTSSWRSITGRTTERRANISAAVRDGLAGGAEGFLVTDWGDVGHRQQWPISLHAITHASEAAWAGAERWASFEAASLHAFGDRAMNMSRWLDDFGDADLALRRIGGRRAPGGEPSWVRNASVLFNDMHPPFEGADGMGTVEDWRGVRERLGVLRTTMPGASTPWRRELDHSMAVAQFAADRGLTRRGDSVADRLPGVLADRMEEIIAEHRRLWLMRSRPGGLESSCRHYEGVLAALRAG